MNKPSEKPSKPYRDFPLTPHPNGQWCKRIKYKLYYFGQWSDPDGALKFYERVRDDLQNGRTPRLTDHGLTLKDLANLFIDAKLKAVRSGELAQISLDDYKRTCRRMFKYLSEHTLMMDPPRSDKDFAFLK